MSIKDLNVELLPTRTVLTVAAGAKGGWGGEGGDGGDGGFSLASSSGNINFGHDQTVAAVSAADGGDGGSADGGYADAAAAGRDFVSLVPAEDGGEEA